LAKLAEPNAKAPRTMTRSQILEQRVSRGDFPARWRVLTPKMKAVIRFRASGLSVSASCVGARCTRESFYVWKKYNPLFRRTLERALAKAAENFLREVVLLRPRGAVVLDESLDSDDPHVRLLAARSVFQITGHYQSDRPQSITAQRRTSGPPPDVARAHAAVEALLGSGSKKQTVRIPSED
jgi:hypothetical protein